MTNEERQLYPEDLERVRQVTTTRNNAIERKPFRPFLLLAIVVVVLTLLSFLSIFIASLHV